MAGQHLSSLVICLASGALAGCGAEVGSAFSEPPRASAAPASTVPHLTTLVVKEGVETPFLLEAPANSPCLLREEESVDSTSGLKLHSGDKGVVRLRLRANWTATASTRFSLDCQADGQLVTRSIEVRVATGSEESSQTPEPPRIPSRPLRPVLEGDAMALSQAELRARGYPPRPDAAVDPRAYARWLASVSRPAIKAESALIARPDVRADHAVDSSNWSGLVLDNLSWDDNPPRHTAPYDAVAGEWFVPSVTGDPNPDIGQTGTDNHSLIWVGLDGRGAGNDLIQAGTEQEAFTSMSGAVTTTSYHAWIEYVPLGLQELDPNTEFPISAGDQILVWVWNGDQNGGFDLNGGYGWFYIEDQTQNPSVIYQTSIARPAGATAFSGSDVEWVVERPRINGRYDNVRLANFGETTVPSFEFHDTVNGYVFHDLESLNPGIITMNSTNIYGSTHPLALTTFATTPHANCWGAEECIVFDWQDYGP